jgi:hypothetical protein
MGIGFALVMFTACSLVAALTFNAAEVISIPTARQDEVRRCWMRLKEIMERAKKPVAGPQGARHRGMGPGGDGGHPAPRSRR